MLIEMFSGSDSLDSVEINTFQPARLHLPGVTTDVLLDSLGPTGGSFFVMTDGERFPGLTLQAREEFFACLDKVELEWQNGSKGWSLTCRVSGFSLDEEGVAAYLKLKFTDMDPGSRSALENFKASLW